MDHLLSVKRKLVIYMALMMIARCGLYAQDPHFSQFFANPVYTNPAFAGSSNHGRAVMNARNQWSSISGTFNTFNAAYDEHYDIINGGLGFMVTRDQAGVGLLTTTTVSAAYSYIIPVNKYLTLRASVQAGVVQKSLDFNNFTWGDQILRMQGIVKPTTGQQAPEPSIVYPNFAAGFIAYTRQFYGGLAVHNLTEPNQGFYKTPPAPVYRRITAHAGLQIPLTPVSKNLKNNTSISPNVLFMQQGQTFRELNLGMYYNKGVYVLGAYLRQTAANTDAFIMLLGLRKEKLRIGVSYDATLSKARSGAGGSYEVSVAIELRKRIPKRSVRAIRCPEF
jgi:type IX secretion system PorP/SprF family membrane protein